ncbi:hypothetical protein [Fodinibius sp. AD559]|uniref:hypothetical protein n=1 Tax=Fodinibius sp. AD559 TaxID=3424179 RepID=UPI004046C635
MFASSMAFAQNNSSDVDQVGTDNSADINQVYDAGQSAAMNQAVVNQDGVSNEVRGLNQKGAGNYYGIIQSGEGNIVQSHPEQGGQGGVNSYDGFIHIAQFAPGEAAGNKVWDADQAGEGNLLTINQTGGDIANVEAQVSTGSGEATNQIYINQGLGENSVGEYSHNGPGAYQEGTDNIMTITQSGDASAGTESKLVSGADDTFFRGNAEGGQALVQLGEMNNLNILQNGASEVEYAIQTDNSDASGWNMATISQTGDDHIVDLEQHGANTATVTQTGGNHSASVWQSGSNTATITQN